MSERTMRTRSIAAALLVALATAGCIDHSKDVARYRTILDGEAPPPLAPFEPDDPLPLVRALQVANADNETIASSGEDYIQALAEKMRQAGTFLPTLSLVPSYTLSRSRSNGGFSFVNPGDPSGAPIVFGGGGGTEDQFSVTARSSVTGSLTNASNLGAAGRTADQLAQLLLDQRETILLQVVEAYYAVLRAEREVAVLENSVALRAEQVRDQEARLELGAARPLDVAQSQADLAGTRVSLTQARTDAANARSALARLMGVVAVRGPLTDEFQVPSEAAPVEDWLTTALSRRQDLIAAEHNLEAARLQVEGAIRQYFPSVSIDFQYFLHNEPSSSQVWSGGISANVPIFSALQIEADIRRAWSVYRQAGLNRSATRRAVTDDVTQSYQNLASSRAKVADLEVQVAAARRAADLAERLYRLGSQSNLDRLTQQDALLSAELELLNERFNEKTAHLSLLRAAGLLSTVLPGVP